MTWSGMSLTKTVNLEHRPEVVKGVDHRDRRGRTFQAVVTRQ